MEWHPRPSAAEGQTADRPNEGRRHGPRPGGHGQPVARLQTAAASSGPAQVQARECRVPRSPARPRSGRASRVKVEAPEPAGVRWSVPSALLDGSPLRIFGSACVALRVADILGVAGCACR